MLEDQPLDLSVRVGDYAELAREDRDDGPDQRERKDQLAVDDYGNRAAAASLRLRECFEYGQEREDRTCSEDSDDSCSDNNQKNGGARSRSRPPGTKPYKKNLMKRY
ncbi:ecdysteroid-regulated protein e74, partial [Lasius niger]